MSDLPPSANLCLAELQAGDWARLVTTGLEPHDSSQLCAMGLSERRPMQVSKAGDPFIVKVRATRIGLTRALAQKIQVTRQAG